MLEEIISNLQSENKSNLKPNQKLPMRQSLLIQSHEVNNFQNKSMSLFFNTLDDGKISIIF